MAITYNSLAEEEEATAQQPLRPLEQGGLPQFDQIAEEVKSRGFNIDDVEAFRGTTGVSDSALDQLKASMSKDVPVEETMISENADVPSESVGSVATEAEGAVGFGTSLAQDPIIDEDPEEDPVDEYPDQVQPELQDGVDWSDLDWLGAKEHSLVVQLGQMIRNQTDDFYDIPGSREALVFEQEYLKEDQALYATLPQDNPEVIELQTELFNDMEKNANALQALDAMENQEGPELSEIWEALVNDPERFAFNFVQETLNKPELVVAGIAGGYGFALLGAKVVGTMGITGKALATAKIVGATTGAYSGGVVTGTIDRSIESANKTGNWNLGSSFDQSQLDGIIALTTFGAFKGTSKLVGNFKKTKTNQDLQGEFEEKMIDSSEANFAKLRDQMEPTDAEKLQAVNTPSDAVSIYKDAQGVVHMVETKTVKAPVNMLDTIELMGQTEKKLSPTQTDRLTKIVNAAGRDIETMELRASEISSFVDDPKALTELAELNGKIAKRKKTFDGASKKLENHELAIDAHNKLYAEDLPTELKPAKYIEVEGPNGDKIMLKRLDPEMDLTKEGITIDGFSASDFTLAKGKHGYNNVADAIRMSMYSGAIMPLKKLAESSPTAALLIAKLDPNVLDNKAPMRSLQSDITLSTGVWNHEMSGIIKELSEGHPGTKAQAEKDVMNFMRQVDIESHPAVLVAAAKIRRMLDNHLKFSKESGVNVTNAGPNWLPRKFIRDELGKDKQKQLFIQRVMVDEGKSRTEATDNWKRIVDDLSEDNDVLTTRSTTANQAPFGKRSLNNIEDADISELLSTDFFADLTKHLMRGSRRAEMAKVYGDNGSKLREMIEQISKEGKESGRILEKAEEQRLYDVYNAIAGKYKPIETEALALANNGLATIQNISKLGLATVTSLTEPLFAIARMNETTGLSVAANTYVQGLKSAMRIAFKGLKEHEAVIELRELGDITDIAISEALDQMQGAGMTGKLATVNNKFFKMTGLHAYTELSKAMSFHAAKIDIKKTIAKLSTKGTHGKQGATRKRWLRDVGLDYKQAVAWMENGGDVTAPYYKQIQRASVDMMHQIIANPTPINRPLWMSSPKMKLIAQLKGYMISFGNSVLRNHYFEGKALLKEGNKTQLTVKTARTAAAIALIVPGQMLIGAMKDGYNNRNADDKTLLEKVIKASIGQLGPISALAPLVSASGERWAPSAILGTVSPTLGSAGQILMDPRKGLSELIPGHSLLPGTIKKKLAGK